MLIVGMPALPWRLRVQGRNEKTVIVDEMELVVTVHQDIAVLQIPVRHVRSTQSSHYSAPLYRQTFQELAVPEVVFDILVHLLASDPFHAHHRVPLPTHAYALGQIRIVHQRG